MEDYLHLPAQLVQLAGADLGDILTLVKYFAGAGLKQMEDDAAQRTLAAAGFTHNAKGLALVQFKGDVVHGVKISVWNGEIFFQILYFYNGLTHA